MYLEATSVGHDLMRGTSTFTKAPRRVDVASDDVAEVREALEDIERFEPSSYDAEQSAEGSELPAAS